MLILVDLKPTPTQNGNYFAIEILYFNRPVHSAVRALSPKIAQQKDRSLRNLTGKFYSPIHRLGRVEDLLFLDASVDLELTFFVHVHLIPSLRDYPSGITASILLKCHHITYLIVLRKPVEHHEIAIANARIHILTLFYSNTKDNS